MVKYKSNKGEVVTKNVVIEVIGFVAVATAVLGFLYFLSTNNSERLLAVSSCVTDRGVEYETQTNRMPTVSMEKSWYSECGDEVGRD